MVKNLLALILYQLSSHPPRLCNIIYIFEKVQSHYYWPGQRKDVEYKQGGSLRLPPAAPDLDTFHHIATYLHTCML